MEIEKKESQSEGKGGGYTVYMIAQKIFVYLLSLVIVIAAVLFAADKSPNKSFFGYRYYVVLTDSMVPEFASGDVVFVKVTGADDISENDVITFNPSSDGEAYLTHRVVEKINNFEGTGVTCFRTKGDANDSEDSFLIDEDRLIGKVKAHVPKMGIAIRFVQLRWYLLVPILIMAVLFFKLMQYYFSLKSGHDSEAVTEKSDENKDKEEDT